MAEGGGQISKLKQPLYERITRRDVANFSRQLSLLLDAGMPLLRALRTLAKRTSVVKFAKIIEELAQSVEQGNTFANALANYPKLFSPMYVNIVKVGEVGGSLEQALKRLALFTERQLRYQSKLFYAMMYPFVVFSVAVTVIILILVFVFPVFIGLFEDAEDKLPALTRYLAGLGAFIRAWWPGLVILVVVIAVAFSWYRKTPVGRRTLDILKLKLRLPIIGRVGEKIMVAQICETFSLLLKSGIQLIPALRVVSGTAGNVIVEERFAKTADAVEEGKSLQDVMEANQVFPPIVVDMVGVGEESGSLDRVLDRVAESYGEEVDMFLENFNRIIEPILIVLLGGVILIIALAVYLPYWNVDEALTFE